jgi:hypothetical protein
MFYLSEESLLKIAYIELDSENSKINPKLSAKHSFKRLILQIISIDIITNQHARLLVTDHTFQMFIIVDYIKIPHFIDPTLKSFARTKSEPCFNLLEGTVFCLEEYYYERIGLFRREFTGICLEDYILYNQKAVRVINSVGSDYVVFLSKCFIIGHISISFTQLIYNYWKNKKALKKKEHYKIMNLSNCVRSSFFKIKVMLVKIGHVKGEISRCQRFLLRDSSMNIELVVYDELITSKAIQMLEEVSKKLISDHIKIYAY